MWGICPAAGRGSLPYGGREPWRQTRPSVPSSAIAASRHAVGHAPQSVAIANRLWRFNVAGETQASQTLDEPPAEIYLAVLYPQIC